MNGKKKVVVAMSGGVDSSVAAALLQRQGYDCIGVFMRLGNDPADEADHDADLLTCSPATQQATPDSGLRTQDSGLRTQDSSSHKRGCCSTSDAADARYVAGLLDIPFYALNFQHDFGGIIDYFVREYNAGRTPNPCVRCNEYLKFGKLSRYAPAVGADFVATGHYARSGRWGETHLLRGRDLTKDQSYVLFGVPRGGVAADAAADWGHGEDGGAGDWRRRWGCRCLTSRIRRRFVLCRTMIMRGWCEENAGGGAGGGVGEAAGRWWGRMRGTSISRWGSGRGSGVAFGHPIYVTGIDAGTNTVMVGKEGRVAASELGGAGGELDRAGEGGGPQEPVRVRAKIRYNSKPAPATAMMTGDGSS